MKKKKFRVIVCDAGRLGQSPDQSCNGVVFQDVVVKAESSVTAIAAAGVKLCTAWGFLGLLEHYFGEDCGSQ